MSNEAQRNSLLLLLLMEKFFELFLITRKGGDAGWMMIKF